MARSDHDEDGRDHTPEEIATAQAEVDEEIRQRNKEWERGAEERRRRERARYG